MPLAFSSQSHGTVAFGFFNIDIDMLLLERVFFFAHRFCAAVSALADAAGQGAGEGAAVTIPGFEIADASKVGNVNAAIRGRDLSGFIGATYERFPFPADPAAFKQKPDTAHNRDWAEETIRAFGEERAIPVRWRPRAARVAIAEVEFSPEEFAELIAYVDRGGYPRWKDEVRPAYVREMLEKLRGLSLPLIVP
jgi:hypothetical protein